MFAGGLTTYAYIFSYGKVEMDPVKLAGVRNWPAPKNVTEVQSFLGFLNFYRRFVRDFSTIAQPLNALTRKDTPWQWGSHQQEAFDHLKECITTTPVLVQPDNTKPYRLETDSSGYATGAILSQMGPSDKWHPVAYYSKSLSGAERNYNIHDKELLSVVRALKEWRHLLEGARHPIEIWNDHKNLAYFQTAQHLNRRQSHWSLTLAQFNFILQHRLGKKFWQTRCTFKKTSS